MIYVDDANSAAWTKKKGEGEVITALGFSTNKPVAFINNSEENELSYYDKREVKLFTEWGFTDNITAGFVLERNKIRVGSDLNFKSTIEDDAYPIDDMLEYLGSIGKTDAEFNALSTSEKNAIYSDFLKEKARHKISEDDSTAKIFARKKLLIRGNYAMSLQAAYQFPLSEKDNLSERINYSNTKRSWELRWSNGYAFKYMNEKSIFNQSHFFNVDLAYKKLIDSFYDEVKFDASVGIRMNRNSFLLFETFHTYNNCSNYKYGPSNPFDEADSECSVKAGEQAYGLNPKNNDYLKTASTQFKVSSIVRFSDLLSTQLGCTYSVTDFEKSYGVELGFWFNI